MNRDLDREHWKIPGLNHHSWTNGDWHLRSKRVAEEFIPPSSVVLDLGCGAMHLEKYLKNCKYLPSDIASRDNRTLICDLERDPIPRVKDVTHLVCLGVLPHLNDQVSSLNKMIKYSIDNKTSLLFSHKLCAPGAISEDAIRMSFNSYDMKYHKTLIVKTGPADDYLFISESKGT